MTDKEARWVEINLEMFTYNYANMARQEYNKVYLIVEALAGVGDYNYETVKWAMDETAYNRSWMKPNKEEAIIMSKEHKIPVREACNVIGIGMQTYYSTLKKHQLNEVIIKPRLARDVLAECAKFLDTVGLLGGLYYGTKPKGLNVVTV